MATGVIVSYDPEEETGYIDPDEGDDHIPFDAQCVADADEGPMLQEGQRVEFDVEGGLAGLMCRHMRRL